jgi:hypothetical protein
MVVIVRRLGHVRGYVSLQHRWQMAYPEASIMV